MTPTKQTLKSRYQIPKIFIYPPMTLALVACGGGSENGGETNSNGITGSTSNDTNTINTVTNGTETLNSYLNVRAELFEGQYVLPDLISVSAFDQSYSESYLVGTSKHNTTKAAYPASNSIAGLLYIDPRNTALTDSFWAPDSDGQTIISYSFFDTTLKLLDETAYSNGSLNEIYNSTFTDFTLEEQEYVRLALAEFEKVLNIKFVEVDEVGNQVGTIRFGKSNANIDAAGLAVPPSNYWPDSGDIWMINGNFGSISQGSGYGFGTLLHELGHALGLKHPHDTDDGVKLETSLDVSNYTLMSYENPSWEPFGETYTLTTSLMVYDILALQYLYGANTSYNSSNTHYKFDAATPTALTVFDSGGEDLLDFSNFDLSCAINLQDGSYSTISYLNWNVSANFGIAFGTIIENVAGSSSSDTILGNEVANEIMGYAGDDILYGYGGNDVFDWANDSRDGLDTMYGGQGDDVYVLGPEKDTVIEYLNEGSDTIYVEFQASYTLPENVENVIAFGKIDYELTGNQLNNTIRGSSGDDIFEGRGGADDFLLYLGMGNDKVIDFNSSEGDEVLLAYGLTSYDTQTTPYGLTYTLSDGSSLELVYDLIA